MTATEPKPCPGCGRSDRTGMDSGLRHHYTPDEREAFWYQRTCGCGWAAPSALSRVQADLNWQTRAPAAPLLLPPHDG